MEFKFSIFSLFLASQTLAGGASIGTTATTGLKKRGTVTEYIAIVTYPQGENGPAYCLKNMGASMAGLRICPPYLPLNDSVYLFIAQANSDFQDFAMIGDAQASLDDGILTLRIDLRPADKRS